MKGGSTRIRKNKKYGLIAVLAVAIALFLAIGQTEMMIEVQAKGDPRILERMVKGDLGTFRCGISMGRLAKPEEQAAMVVYLASDKADYITGQTFIVDGGQAMF